MPYSGCSNILRRSVIDCWILWRQLCYSHAVTHVLVKNTVSNFFKSIPPSSKNIFWVSWIYMLWMALLVDFLIKLSDISDLQNYMPIKEVKHSKSRKFKKFSGKNSWFSPFTELSCPFFVIPDACHCFLE